MGFIILGPFSGVATTLHNLGGPTGAIESDSIAVPGIIRPGDQGKQGNIAAMDAADSLINSGGIHVANQASMVSLTYHQNKKHSFVQVFTNFQFWVFLPSNRKPPRPKYQRLTLQQGAPSKPSSPVSTPVLMTLGGLRMRYFDMS